MSNRLLNLAWKAKCETLAQKFVLVRLADFAGQDGLCWPSHRTVAGDIGISDRAVRDAITALASAGHLTVESEAGRVDHGGSRFRYHVHPTTPEAPSPVTPEQASGVKPDDTGKRRHPHRKTTTSTPENDDIHTGKRRIPHI